VGRKKRKRVPTEEGGDDGTNEKLNITLVGGRTTKKGGGTKNEENLGERLLFTDWDLEGKQGGRTGETSPTKKEKLDSNDL